MTCRFCNEDKSLGKSHIIPESFFPIPSDDPRAMKLLSNKPNEFPKKAPIGVYDKTILCHSCEKSFDKVDNYAHKLLIKEQENHRPITKGIERVAYEIPSYDYNLLKSFFVSLLWRASVSTESFFGRIKLGKFESVALDYLESNTPIPAETFSVILAKFDHPLGNNPLDPFQGKIDGINYNTFYLSGYIAYIKTDNRPTRSPLSELMMIPSQPLKIISRDFANSQEFAILKNIVNASGQKT